MRSEGGGPARELGYRRIRGSWILPAATLIVLAGCGQSEPAASQEASQSAPARASAPPSAERRVLQVGRAEQLTEQQVAQDSDVEIARRLLVATVPVGQWDRAEELARQGIGGIVLLGSTNDLPAAEVRRHLGEIREAAASSTHGPGSRTWIISDEEGGNVQRLSAITGDEPSARSLGDKSPAAIEKAARAYGTELKAAGVDAVFAPVADVGTSGWMGEQRRTFGADAAEVGEAALAWASGMSAAGLATTAKHWPGHGGVAEDTHEEFAVTAPWASLQERETAAFGPLIANGVPMVMVGHLRVPGLTEGKLPASVSPSALAELRAQAGPEAVIVTDDMNMKAIREVEPTQAGAAVAALEAGADLVIVSQEQVSGCVKAIAKAMESGRLPRAQAVQSAVRIANAKSDQLP